MNKQGGFTLIELLAVIVILAIIAVIAVPIVLNIIDETKNNATLRSAEMYVKAAELSIANSTLKDKNITDGTYKLKDGDICLNTDCTDKLEVEVNGDVPDSGSITITSGAVSAIQLVYDGKTIVQDEKGKLVYQEEKADVKVCTIERQDTSKYSIGDIITCELENSTEQFYVMEDESSDTTEGIDMLTMYNLNVGDNPYPEGTIGIQNENVYGHKNGYPLNYGNVAFSTQVYESWKANDYIYGKETDIVYSHVEFYKKYLLDNGVNVVDAKLPSLQQMQTLFNCGTAGDDCNDTYPWVMSTSYWLGTPGCDPWYDEYVLKTTIYVYFIYARGNPRDNSDVNISVNYGKDYNGVRPLITIQTSEIQ